MLMFYFSTEPARFETPSANKTAKLGETIKLVCVARGDTPLSSTWSHQGRVLPNSDYRYVSIHN